ncbi:MAG TPA: hypothetical protein VL147_05040 [Devosia sp.]|nr:hypothetical protein [Devosia sp.]
MFVERVAAGRNVSADAVRNGFGQGRMVGAKGAVNRMTLELIMPEGWRAEIIGEQQRRRDRPAQCQGQSELSHERGQLMAPTIIGLPAIAGCRA